MHTTPIPRSDPTLRRSHRVKAIVALAAASLALIAAVPANSMATTIGAPGKPPVDKNGKKSCPEKIFGQPGWRPHGSVRETWAGGQDFIRQRCNDGTWETLRTSHDGGVVGGTRGAVDPGSVGAKVVRVSPSQPRHLSITPR